MVENWGDWTMEESSPQSSNGQIGSAGGVNKQNENNNQRPQYSIPGILHFIQHEWAKFEMERSQWEVHRAELEAKIAFLQGERKGQENLKNDLVRRIKMLEYALKQERAKYHKLKYGTDLNQGDMSAPIFDEPGAATEITADAEAPFTSVSNITWKQGRSLLRQYLQEIGYTDTIIDVRSNKVKTLLGLNNINNNNTNNNNNPNSQEECIPAPGSQTVNGNATVSKNKRLSATQGRGNTKKTVAESMALDTEAAIMANFEFLSREGGDVDMEEDDDDDDNNEEVDTLVFDHCRAPLKRELRHDMHDVDAEAEEVLNELHLLTESEDVSSSDIRSQNSGMFQVVSSMSIAASNEDEGGDSAFALGELAQLTVNNDVENSYEMSADKESYRKTWNAKYTLRSHFDGVRALAFHPTEPVLITASEDRSLKLWNLQKIVTSKKSASLDVEPLYTFRKHLSPVLCVAINSTGEECYSGCQDGQIYCWNVPSANIDPYDSYDPGVLNSTLEGHTDAIWGLSLNTQKSQLLSCSADGTVKLWSPTKQKSSLLSTYVPDQANDGNPTSADFIRDDMNRIMVSYTSGNCIIYDIETCKPILRLEQPAERASYDQVNRLICHPTLPVTITAHEDRHIRFYDNTTGKMVHWMVAHLDAVTSLAIDPSGLFLLSGSHDCSIRFWNLDTKTCVQEITAHRKKFDESIHDVAFHPSKPYIASSGADGLAKVFVC
ncbi:striatin-3 isoform X2 [Planococcus citri]|uniref:striatin-3 isoform X2 n=1 Tax=Planococcus citri TaxID=170843 RepID=UPI0031F9873B